jgi:ankyrin repeat protein
LVNCGENIDKRTSIAAQAPIHKAVQSEKEDNTKTAVIDSIAHSKADLDMIDSNGWTALHHAAYNGDIASVRALIRNKAQINAFSN